MVTLSHINLTHELYLNSDTYDTIQTGSKPNFAKLHDTILMNKYVGDKL